MDKIAVTGLGIDSPSVIGKRQFCANPKSGRSVFREITRFDASKYPAHVAGQIDDLEKYSHVTERLLKKIDVFSHMALIASELSLQDAGLDIKKEDPDGIIPCFKSNQSRYSYVRSNKSGYISEVAEKRVISNLATTGMYYFKRGADFIDAAKKMIARNNLENGEFYVGPCYNQLIKSGKKIRSVMATEIHIVGTPEELKKYLKYEKNKVYKKK